MAIEIDKGDEQRRDCKGIYAECAAVLRQVGRHVYMSASSGPRMHANNMK